MGMGTDDGDGAYPYYVTGGTKQVGAQGRAQ